MKPMPHLNIHHLTHNDTAVIDLPVYLVITIIIGIFVLGGILSMIFLPSFFTPTPVVTINPLIAMVNNTSTSIQYQVLIQTPDQKPIANAHVIIKNDQTIRTNITNISGMTMITVQPKIPQGLHETFFDVLVKTSTYKSVEHRQMLKVVLRR